jgi:prophage antirepressor-like protein
MIENFKPVLIYGVSCYEQDGTAYLRLEDVARGLGFTEVAASGNTCIKWTRVRKYLDDLGVDTCVDGHLPDFIPENIFYRLAMKAKNETAEKFQALVADEIIPSIRKTGSYTVPKLSKEMQALFLLDQRTVQQDARLTALENTMTVDYGQQQTLKKAVGRVVVEALGGKTAPAYIDPHVRGKLFSECNRDVQDWFRVNSVCNVPRKRYDEALDYIQRWKPSTNSAMQVQNINAQTSLY